ncbi:MAG: DUF4142 domain-containing protein [Burkholderiaceae bacterium]
MKFTRTLIGIATGLALAQGAAAIDLSNDDQRFLREAGESGMLEMQASELAVQKAENPELKRYAEMMIKDHGAVDQELKALAQRKGFQLPVELEGGKLRLMENLRQLEGAGFDEEYADEVAVDAHEDAVELFEDAAEDADDDEVRAFAAKHLPALQNHLEMGRQLEDLVDDARRNAASRPDAAAVGPAGEPIVPETRR